MVNQSIRHSEMSNLLLKRRMVMKRYTKIRALMLTLFLLLGTIPASAVERPFALNVNGVATLITVESGNMIGAIATGCCMATHLGLWTVIEIVKYTHVNIVVLTRVEDWAI